MWFLLNLLYCYVFSFRLLGKPSNSSPTVQAIQDGRRCIRFTGAPSECECVSVRYFSAGSVVIHLTFLGCATAWRGVGPTSFHNQSINNKKYKYINKGRDRGRPKCQRLMPSRLVQKRICPVLHVFRAITTYTIFVMVKML